MKGSTIIHAVLVYTSLIFFIDKHWNMLHNNAANIKFYQDNIIHVLLWFSLKFPE